MFKYRYRGKKHDLLFLPGWGFDPFVIDCEKLPFNMIVPEVPIVHVQQCHDSFLLKRNDFFILGWSLGAHIAYELLLSGNYRVKGAILACFSCKFDEAMIDEKIIHVKSDPYRALKALYMLCFHSGHDYKSFKRQHEGRCISFWDSNNLIDGLKFLKYHTIFLEKIIDHNLMIIQSSRDRVAVVDDRNDIETEILSIKLDSGHFPFTSDKFYDEISTFYKKIC